MKRRQYLAFLLVCILTLACAVAPAAAADSFDDSVSVLRVSGRLNQSIPAKSTVTVAEGFYLAEGDAIEYDCTYTPRSASVDFGVIAPDGLFYAMNSTTGSINQSLQVSQTGRYTLAIRNNESYAVSVTGTVRY